MVRLYPSVLFNRAQYQPGRRWEFVQNLRVDVQRDVRVRVPHQLCDSLPGTLSPCAHDAYVRRKVNHVAVGNPSCRNALEKPSAVTTSWEPWGYRSPTGSDVVDVVIRLTASAFEVSQDDILTRDPNNANITIQGGRQSSKGAELAVSAIPTPSFRIDVQASFMRAQFDELIESGGANRAGNVPTNAPERSAGVWASYRFSAWPLTIGAGVHGQGRSFGNNANTVRVDGCALVDAKASWSIGPGDMTVRAKNLTNAF
jgi:hypothetical protein